MIIKSCQKCGAEFQARSGANKSCSPKCKNIDADNGDKEMSAHTLELNIRYNKRTKMYTVRVNTDGISHQGTFDNIEKARWAREQFKAAKVEKMINGELVTMSREVDLGLRAADDLIRRPWK